MTTKKPKKRNPQDAVISRNITPLKRRVNALEKSVSKLKELLKESELNHRNAFKWIRKLIKATEQKGRRS